MHYCNSHQNDIKVTGNEWEQYLYVMFRDGRKLKSALWHFGFPAAAVDASEADAARRESSEGEIMIHYDVYVGFPICYY